MPRPTWITAALLGLAACGGGRDWVGEATEPPRAGPTEDGWKGGEIAPDPPRAIGGEGAPLAVRENIDPSGANVVRVVAEGSPDDLFRNTYYDFPREGAGDRAATLYDAACAPIVKVTQTFHDQVCVQGSGRLASGATVSFAKRDCACASTCPRTGQKICYERLDPARFPHGRGAAGRPITPLVTVAVDTAVIPLGTRIRIPEFVGVPRPDGTPHDGCFVAEDRGLKVVGRQIDVFTGDPAVTARWNQLVPSNRGVHVRRDDPACRP